MYNRPGAGKRYRFNCGDAKMSRRPNTEEHFWGKVKKTRACWIWTASTFPNGYGQIRMDGKHYGTHRLAWILTNGSIPDGLFVCHKCDNKLCVNPKHLFLGTMMDNYADMKQKGRQARGDRNANAKLTDHKIREMRRIYKSGGISLRSLATQFGVTFSPTQRIIRGEAWKHVTDGG